jgi:formylglycine-generating enzyme required for sulfatase activity
MRLVPGSLFALVVFVATVVSCTTFGAVEQANDAASTGDAESSSVRGGPMVQIEGTFRIDATEVTNASYDRFLGEVIGNTFDASSVVHEHCGFNTSYARGPDCKGATAPNMPVTCVDWCDAWAYCAWAGKRLCGKISGKALLPDERADISKSQWTLACAGISASSVPYQGAPRANACVTSDVAPSRTVPERVGDTVTCQGKTPGLFDMVGNVSEWEDNCDLAGNAYDNKCRPRGGSYVDSSATALCQFSSEALRREVRPTLGFRCCSL